MPGPHYIYRHIELPFMASLAATEAKGILIDCDKLKQQSEELQSRIESISARAFELAGSEFNLGSPKQLQDILFTELNLPVIKKTPKGQPSTDEEVLSELAENHELPQLILESRSLAKLKNTYTDRLPENVQPGSGRIHTHYHQTVASTGRLSSSEPNLQNIPIRTEEGRKIRQAIIAPEGYTMLAADYSQIELRIMAHLSKDNSLIEAFNAQQDIHARTAMDVFDLDKDNVEADYRRKAKAINFGLIYGMSAFGLAKQIGVSRSEAGQYIEVYFNQYPGVKIYMENIRQFAKELGHVETIFGRRLYIPDITSTNVIRRNAAERLAINAPMQGTAADIIKMAMNNIMAKIGHSNDIRLIMQIHDELVFEIKDEAVSRAQSLIKDTMENVCQLDVPLVVDIGSGQNWDDAH